VHDKKLIVSVPRKVTKKLSESHQVDASYCLVDSYHHQLGDGNRKLNGYVSETRL